MSKMTSPNASTMGGTGGVIKTVILPNEDINRLGVEGEELRSHLYTAKALFEEAIVGYERDRRIRQEEFRLKEDDFQSRISDIKSKLEEREG